MNTITTDQQDTGNEKYSSFESPLASIVALCYWKQCHKTIIDNNRPHEKNSGIFHETIISTLKFLCDFNLMKSALQ